MKKYCYSGLLVVTIFLPLYIIPLGARPLTMPDETRYAEVAREMIASGDWIVMCLDGLLHFEKPVLGYWIKAISILLFGENNFAVRLPSALSIGITALMLFFIVRRFGGGFFAGSFAAGALLISPICFGIGTYNNLDGIISMFVTGSMVSFFLSYAETDFAKRRMYLALCGVFLGMGFLTKGLLALVVPFISIVPFLIWERRLGELIRLSWLPLVVALVVALPWSVAIHLRENDFWSFFIWAAHFERFVSADAPHSSSFFFFIPVLMMSALPFTFLLPASILGLKEKRLKDPLVRFALCWFIFPFLFFSASHGKLITYILPFYPPFVILVTVGLIKYLTDGKNRAFSVGVASLAAFVGLMAAVIALNKAIAYYGYTFYSEGETWKWIFVITGLLVWVILCVLAIRESDLRKKLLLFLIAPLLFMLSTNFVIPNFFNERKAVGEFLISHSNEIHPETEIVTYGHMVTAICWFYKRDDVRQIISISEKPFGLRYGDARDRLLSKRHFNKLVKENGGKERVVLILKKRDYEKFIKRFPEALSVDANGSFVFVQF